MSANLDMLGRANESAASIAAQHRQETDRAVGNQVRRTAIEVCGGDPDDPRCHAIARAGVPPAFAGSPHGYLARQLQDAGLAR